MESKVKILDCTLRDGGYVNNWEFSTESIKAIITALVKSNVELVECGFVSQKNGKEHDSSLFKDINQVNILLKSLDINILTTDFCVMINKGEFDIDLLPSYDAKSDYVSIIRYAFHKKDWRGAVEDVRSMINKGYSVYVQAMVTMSYSDSEIIEMLTEFNKYEIAAMYIVDSFGAMFGDDFRRLHYLFENNLKKGISLGYHSHNNLQLAYSNAIDFIQIREITREIIIDSSIHGMGRGAGNLTTELVADYLNKKKQTKYNIIPLLEAIDKYLEYIYKENYWGYSIAHFLSASNGCHPNYATYLVNTKTLSIVDIETILSMLNNSEKANYSKSRINELYIEYKSSKGLEANLELNYFNGKDVLIIASGPNSENQKELVLKCIDEKKPVLIAVNHVPKSYNPDYCFFSNQKRFDKFKTQLENNIVIITSNIHVDVFNNKYKIVDYNGLVLMTKNKSDNVTVLLLNLLTKQSAKNIYVAGLDGYLIDSNNYSYTEYDKLTEKNDLFINNKNISNALDEIRKNKSINFITKSIFE